MDHYLAIIQTILDRCENDNTSPDIHDHVLIFWRGRDGVIMSCLRTIQTQRFINAKETDTSARIRGSISTSGQTRSSRTRKCR